MRSWLEHPATRGMDIDDTRTTDRRNEIIQSKPVLRAEGAAAPACSSRLQPLHARNQMRRLRVV